MVQHSLVQVGAWPTVQGERTKSPAAAPEAAVFTLARPAAFPIRSFLAFILALVVVSGLTCVYIWQLSQVAAIRLETQALNANVQQLELENVSLMLAVAEHNSPAEIQVQARALGMTPQKEALHVAIGPTNAQAAAAASAAGDEPRTLAVLWENLFGSLIN